MTIKPFIFGVMVLVIFTGVVFGFQSAGIWSVSGKITRDGQAVQPTAGEVESIKGWMTLEQVSKAFGIPLNQILAAFSLPQDTPATTALKDLESETFSVEGLREWLAAQDQPGKPAESEEPAEAVEPLPTALPLEPTKAPESAEHIAPDRTVTGKTTFQDLLDWGVKEEDLVRVIGGELPPASTLVRDHVTQQGKSFSEVKAVLQAEVDRVKAP